MGFVSDIVGGLFGGGQQEASTDAAGVQAASADKAINFQRDALKIVREDLQPYRTTGANALTGLNSLITDPNEQKKFISQNPFFNSLAEKSKNTIFNNAAAKGKVGSGGTAEALQNSLLLLGNDLLNQNITQRQNLVNTGESAAAQTGTATQNAATSISDLYTQQGNAQASGIVGKANAGSDAVSNLIGTGAALWSLSDVRAKENIKRVGHLDNGLPVYTFHYKGDKHICMNVMAQDVEKVMPKAVKEIDGMKHVNMEMIAA